ncbi:MAG: class I SAM-dependent methyltransferase [bacterium]
MKLLLDPDQVKGFLDPEEGARLFELACEVSALGPCLEVGSYCGKSTLYLGSACRRESNVLFALDHHRGSEEHQRGEQYHDPDLYDAVIDRMDTLPALRRTLSSSQLEECVVPLVGSSALVGRFWQTPLAMVFIDGGHSLQAALTDYRTWASHIVRGGILAIHDIFPDPADGGQAPYTIYKLALASGLFEALQSTKTLGVLRRC